MPVCPPPSRKHTAFGVSTLARGLHSDRCMPNRFLFLAALLAAPMLPAAPSLAQTEQEDTITTIDEESTVNVTRKYFNAENCADPTNTLYDLTLTNADGVTNAYLWAGVQNAGCEQNSKRTDQQLLCRQMAGSTPAQVGDNATIFNLTLQELVDSGIVDCQNTALVGQPYWIYSFRTEDPGGLDVATDGYGIAEFWVDVTPPDELSLTSQPVQDGSQFTITWSSPADSTEIQLYKLYRSDSGDPASAVDTGLTAQGTATTFSVNASALDLAGGESTSLFVTAVDMAAVTPGNGNEGPLSEATAVTAAQTLGFCDDPTVDCSGCSVSPMVLANGQPSSGLWVFGLLFPIFCRWRLRR